MAGFAFLWEIGLYVWKISIGETEWYNLLPIGLCAFTLFLGIVALFFKKYSLFEIGYFWTWGALASVLFPDIIFSYDRYRFYQFMIGHSFFFFMYIYMIFVYQWYPTLKSWRKSVIVLISITIILIVISNITNRNLMFMLESEGTPFSIFEGHGYFLYLAGVISLSFIICTAWYLPFLLFNKKSKLNTIKQ
jgi:hypothetical integral membrane protein (TIGR02206 family)